MRQIEVRLEHHTPLSICKNAIRTCWQSHGKSDTPTTTDTLGDKDITLIDNISNKYRHHSTIEHIHYTFDIVGISRLCLIELTRHRLASYSVKSTRYTLQELKDLKPLLPFHSQTIHDMNKFLVTPNYTYLNKDIYLLQVGQLERLRLAVKGNVKTDIAKYLLPESYRTELYFTINARSLRNLLELRLSNKAHFEIRYLAKLLYNALPQEHRVLFSDIANLKDT